MPYKRFLRIIVLAEAIRIKPSFSFQTADFTALWLKRTKRLEVLVPRDGEIEVSFAIDASELK